jgi:thioredoxin 1
MSKMVLVRIIAAVLVILALGAIWFVKTGSRKTEIPATIETVTAAPSAIASGESPATDTGDLLITTKMDLPLFRSSGLPVVIDFGSKSCIPCKEMAPVLEELNKSLKGKAIIRFVDVWKYRDLASDIPLQVIPTQLFFDASGKPYTPDEALRLPFIQYNAKTTGEHVFTMHEGGLTKEQLQSILVSLGMKQ